MQDKQKINRGIPNRFPERANSACAIPKVCGVRQGRDGGTATSVSIACDRFFQERGMKRQPI